MEEIDLKELFYVFWKNISTILIVGILFAIIGVVYSLFLVKPMFKSSTSLVLSKSSNQSDKGEVVEGITQSDIILNQKLVSTYGEIIKSRSVLNEVKSNLKLDISVDNLTELIKVSSKEDTELLQIVVSYKEPETAAKIADELADVFKVKVKEVYNIENVSIIDKAEVNEEPYNINVVKSLIVFMFIGLVLVCSILFLKFYLKNTISSPDEVEKMLDLPILAVVPKIDD